MEVSYCVVNTNGRELLLSCLEAIARTHPAGLDHEILVLDNASDDGSADAVAARFPKVRLIARERRAGLAENNTLLLREARGRFCLLLNEDSEILDGAARALLDALDADPQAAIAGAQLVDPGGVPIACAWRFPGPGTALAQALFLHRWLVTQSGGSEGDGPREVGWVQSCTMLVRREAAEGVGYLDPGLLRLLGGGGLPEAAPRLRLADPPRTRREGRPPRAARHRPLHREHDASSSFSAAERPTCASITQPPPGLSAASFGPGPTCRGPSRRTIMPGHDAHRYWLHARQALRPTHGEGMREAAEAYNLKLGAAHGDRATSGQVPGRSSSRATAS